MKTFVLNSDNGFTYIELLISLAILALILVIMPPVLKTFQLLDLNSPSFDYDIFIEDIIEVEKNKKNILVTNNSIKFESKSGLVQYKLSNNRIVKTIDNKGFITLMFDVHIFTCVDKGEFIQILISEGDDTHTFSIKK